MKRAIPLVFPPKPEALVGPQSTVKKDGTLSGRHKVAIEIDDQVGIVRGTGVNRSGCTRRNDRGGSQNGPIRRVSVDTFGWVSPAGHTVKEPTFSVLGTTVKFGRVSHGARQFKHAFTFSLRGWSRERTVPAAMYGDPKVLLAGKVPPAAGVRVSMIRHGVTVIN